MGSLHFFKLGTLLACWRNNTVRAEVALVWARIVVACVYAVYTLLHLLWVINRLVNPVPNATADARVGCFNLLPVLLEVTDGITHCVCIFADEHWLVEVVGVLVHPSLSGVHL